MWLWSKWHCQSNLHSSPSATFKVCMHNREHSEQRTPVLSIFAHLRVRNTTLISPLLIAHCLPWKLFSVPSTGTLTAWMLPWTLNLERPAEYKWQGRVFCFGDRGIMTVRVEKRAAKDLRKICYLSADWDIVTRPGAFYSHWGSFHLFTRFSTLMSCRYVTCRTNVSTDCITFTEHRTLRLNYGNGSNGSSDEWINLNPT